MSGSLSDLIIISYLRHSAENDSGMSVCQLRMVLVCMDVS